MKVRYWNSKHMIARGTTAKDLVRQIKLGGTDALSMPNGNVNISQLFFILGGRDSIAQFLSASRQGGFCGPERIVPKYLRVNLGIGKHYTIVALGSSNALTLLGSDGLGWSDLRLTYAQMPINLNGPALLVNYLLPYSELANALRGAESQLTSNIIEYAGI